jgi:hypothetical protein
MLGLLGCQLELPGGTAARFLPGALHLLCKTGREAGLCQGQRLLQPRLQGRPIVQCISASMAGVTQLKRIAASRGFLHTGSPNTAAIQLLTVKDA